MVYVECQYGCMDRQTVGQTNKSCSFGWTSRGILCGLSRVLLLQGLD